MYFTVWILILLHASATSIPYTLCCNDIKLKSSAANYPSMMCMCQYDVICQSFCTAFYYSLRFKIYSSIHFYFYRLISLTKVCGLPIWVTEVSSPAGHMLRY